VIGRIGQGLELIPDLISPPIQVSPNQPRLTFIRHLYGPKGFGAPPTVPELAPTGRA
jgi:hypothetical protein